MATCKRKLDSEDLSEDVADVKKTKLESEDSTNITNLSDCILFTLLSYLDATSLYQLSKTCQRFHYLVKDANLWKYIDARRPPNTTEKVRYIEERFNEKTTHILFSADARYKEIISNKLFTLPYLAENLTVLALENQYIDGRYFPLRSYPISLRELSFKRTYIRGGTNFFRFSKNLEQLRVLILDHCQWVETSNLMSIANFKNLEILSLYMCKKLSDTNIGYISLSGKFGFKNLKILDVRFTGLGNQLLSSVYKSTTIQELYFQGYTTTYQLERCRRKLDIARGAKPEEHSYLSDDEEHLDTSVKHIQKKYGNDADITAMNMDVVADNALVMYKYVDTNNDQLERPRSLLYRDPYEKCTCNFTEKFWDCSYRKKPEKNDTDSSSDDDGDVKKLKLNLRRRRLKLRKMLKTRQVRSLFFCNYNEEPPATNDESTPGVGALCSESTSNRIRFSWISHREPLSEFEVSQAEHSIPNNMHTTGPIYILHVRHGQDNPQPVTIINRNPREIHVQLRKPQPPTEENDSSSDEEEEAVSSEDDEKSKKAVANLQPQHLRITYREDAEGKIKSCLRRLSLRGFPKVTDWSLDYLGGLNIELLDVRYTNVTAEGVRNFLLQHPSCRVIHESACQCGPRMHF